MINDSSLNIILHRGVIIIKFSWQIIAFQPAIEINQLRVNKCAYAVFIMGSAAKSAMRGNYDAIKWKHTAVNQNPDSQRSRLSCCWRESGRGTDQRGFVGVEGAWREHQLLCWLFRYVQRKATDCGGLKWGNVACCNAITCWWMQTPALILLRLTSHTNTDWQIKAANAS